jgi:hypothetical protein
MGEERLREERLGTGKWEIDTSTPDRSQKVISTLLYLSISVSRTLQPLIDLTISVI